VSECESHSGVNRANNIHLVAGYDALRGTEHHANLALFESIKSKA